MSTMNEPKPAAGSDTARVDIDPVVYLTECDPSDFSAGAFIQAEIVGSRDYDLLARPT